MKKAAKKDPNTKKKSKKPAAGEIKNKTEALPAGLNHAERARRRVEASRKAALNKAIFQPSE